MNEVLRFVAFAAIIFPAIVALLALMVHLESNIDVSDKDDESGR